MILIGLNGRYGSGKDTLAALIAERLPGRNVIRAGFADKLKLSAARALGFLPKDVDEAVRMMNDLKGGVVSVQMPTGKPGLQKYPDGTLGMAQPMHMHQIDGRKYLQIYGTESHRDVFGYDFWVDALLPRPQFAASPGDSLVMSRRAVARTFPDADVVFVTDTRFDNEAERIVCLGGEVWRIDAETRLGPLAADAHVSEAAVDPAYVSCVVDNNGDESELAAAAEALAREIEDDLADA